MRSAIKITNDSGSSTTTVSSRGRRVMARTSERRVTRMSSLRIQVQVLAATGAVLVKGQSLAGNVNYSFQTRSDFAVSVQRVDAVVRREIFPKIFRIEYSSSVVYSAQHKEFYELQHHQGRR